VPEIYDHIIEIKAIAREPGSKAKIAVFAADVSVDPVGSCVGVRGNRVRAITNELNGEKIDVILWDKNIAQFVINSMTPAQISKIVFNEEKRRVETVVPDDQLSLAIGRRGQNVRLASQLTRYDVDILTEAEESERRQEEFRRRTGLFVEALDVDDVIAGLLVQEGFGSIEDIVQAPDEELAEIEGFDESVAAELKRRAETFIEKRDAEMDEKRRSLGVDDVLMDVGGFTPAMMVTLGEKGVKSLEDLADLAGDELVEILGAEALDEETANAIVMEARRRAGWLGDEA
jgi:N utilization substance protein A